nr:2271_t:CDS:2 [Entrophospora candida]
MTSMMIMKEKEGHSIEINHLVECDCYNDNLNMDSYDDDRERQDSSRVDDLDKSNTELKSIQTEELTGRIEYSDLIRVQTRFESVIWDRIIRIVRTV